MNKKTILITGGCGFIGTNLVEFLLSRKYKIINLDILNYPSNKKFTKNFKDYTFKKLDVNNTRIVEKILNKHKPDYVIHLAAETHVDRSIEDGKKFLTANINGTYSMLSNSLKYYKKFKKKKFKFFYLGTDEIFGDLEIRSKKKFNESSIIKPNNPYSASKASAHHVATSFIKTYKMPVIIMNCSNNYGPFQFFEKLIPTVIAKIEKNQNVGLYGKGLNFRDWIYVKDHVNAIYYLLKRGKVGHIYNIGSGKSFSNKIIVNKIYKIMEKIKNKKIPRKIIYVKDRPGHDKKYIIDNSKIKKLGWKLKTSLEDGLEKTIYWYLKKNNKSLFKSQNYKLNRIGKDLK